MRLPGNPADSQFEQISTDSQIAQWNRAPTMSSMQLNCDQLNIQRFNGMTYCAHLTPGCTIESECMTPASASLRDRLGDGGAAIMLSRLSLNKMNA